MCVPLPLPNFLVFPRAKRMSRNTRLNSTSKGYFQTFNETIYTSSKHFIQSETFIKQVFSFWNKTNSPTCCRLLWVVQTFFGLNPKPQMSTSSTTKAVGNFIYTSIKRRSIPRAACAPKSTKLAQFLGAYGFDSNGIISSPYPLLLTVGAFEFPKGVHSTTDKPRFWAQTVPKWPFLGQTSLEASKIRLFIKTLPTC